MRVRLSADRASNLVSNGLRLSSIIHRSPSKRSNVDLPNPLPIPQPICVSIPVQLSPWLLSFQTISDSSSFSPHGTCLNGRLTQSHVDRPFAASRSHR